jgi:hypothetical protein
MATIAFKVGPFRMYAPFPTLLPFLNTSWKSCSVRVFSTACDSASISSVVKIMTFQFYLQPEKQKKVGWAEDDSHVAFSKKIAW